MKIQSIKPFKTAVILSLCFAVQTSFSQQIGNGLEPIITDFNQPLLSGAYSGNAPFTGGTPDVSHPWTHLFTIRHTNTSNNHQLQIASSYTANDRLFFRKLQGVGAVNQAWIELATRGGNNFLGDQNITGVVKTTNEITSTMAGGYAQLRAVNGNYGLMLRNDGANSYFLLTASGDQYGSWNTLRPFAINNVSGEVNIANTTILASQATGKVTIGLINFTKTNEPNYKLFVGGGILTERVKVMEYANWADYVFTKEYKLTPLKEVEKFISENNHLAEIPSAKEIETSGLDLGEIVRLQMQKIEELTLYLIEQNKRIEELEKR
jgi:hypothetical protein